MDGRWLSRDRLEEAFLLYKAFQNTPLIYVDVVGDSIFPIVLMAAVIAAVTNGCSSKQDENVYNIPHLTYASEHCFGITFVSYDSYLEKKINTKTLAKMYVESKWDNAKEKFAKLVLGKLADVIELQIRGSAIPMIHPYILYICQCKEKPYNTRCAIESISWYVDKVPVTEYFKKGGNYAQEAINEAENEFKKICNCDK